MPRRRLFMLILGLPLYTALMMWLFAFIALMLGVPDRWDVVRLMLTPSEWALDDEMFGWLVALPVAGLCISQVLFLAPLMNLRPMQLRQSKSFKLSIVMVALVAVALTVGLAAGLYGLLQLAIATSRGPSTDPVDIEIIEATTLGWSLVLMILLSWVLWTIVLFAFARKRQSHGRISKLIGLLLGGTIVEVIVVLPIDIMIRRRTGCYCGTGTFWALCLSTWAFLWLAGPGIVIAATSKRRRWWSDTHCQSCGYAKGPSPGAVCPECGFSWEGKS